jgi:aldose 1-epimerase
MKGFRVNLWLLGCISEYIAASIPPPDQDGKYTIESMGIKASFIPYAASITNLWIADRNGTQRDIVLGYDNASFYATDPIHPNYGATPGRYVNRIANATYELDGVRYYTQRNNGNSTMHSGTNGWSYRDWSISQVSPDSITFTIFDADNSSVGMPGDVTGIVTYKLAPFTWSIHLEAHSLTRRTPLMLTNHAYWNLDAFANPTNDTILNHTLSLPFSSRMIGYDDAAEANGSLPDVPRYSINDFWSSPKPIGANDSAPGWIGNCGPELGGYDCGWLIDRPDDVKRMAKPMASLWSRWTGIRWDMYSNQEGLAMTSCGFIPPGLLPVKKTQGGGVNDGFVPPFGAVAVEAHDWIDGINHLEWGREREQIYGPESGAYINEIVYKFSVQ